MNQESVSTAWLDGRTAIVSGGARGIGGAVSRSLVDAGANVLVCDILGEEGEKTAGSLGAGARYQKLDVTSEDDWRGACDTAVQWGGGLDILVNCAGIYLYQSILDFEAEQFDRVLDVNLVGTFLGIKHAARVMANGGSIINISSTEGLEASNSMAAYASSKWGVRGLTKVAAIELGERGIRVNSVHPGPVNTPMLNPKQVQPDRLRTISMLRRMPIARVAEPSEIASVCVFLAGGASSFMTGAELAVDGGASVGMFHRGRPGAPA